MAKLLSIKNLIFLCYQGRIIINLTEFHLHRENKIYRKRLKPDINNDYNMREIWI
ncbi:Uncharacterized protein dnl_07070 [Desulfonema limicola]|uniref:Uncharacterized protein n=1 Tax=Desulfonema limicola TaxID=45656 RepID=A0A975B477_9BACT|nr:Uncharacterized protein dnl_07070 [Desulfonema limicola]